VHLAVVNVFTGILNLKPLRSGQEQQFKPDSLQRVKHHAMTTYGGRDRYSRRRTKPRHYMEIIIFKLRPFYPTIIEQKAGLDAEYEKKKLLNLRELRKKVKKQPQFSLEFKLGSP